MSAPGWLTAHSNVTGSPVSTVVFVGLMVNARTPPTAEQHHRNFIVYSKCPKNCLLMLFSRRHKYNTPVLIVILLLARITVVGFKCLPCIGFCCKLYKPIHFLKDIELGNQTRSFVIRSNKNMFDNCLENAKNKFQ